LIDTWIKFSSKLYGMKLLASYVEIFFFFFFFFYKKKKTTIQKTKIIEHLFVNVFVLTKKVKKDNDLTNKNLI
jgi:hypothetical protein